MHKSVKSVLEWFGYRMVSLFPLDVMHLLDLGVAKRIISDIMTKKVSDNYFIKELTCVNLYKKFVDDIAQKHKRFKEFCPTIFARKTLDEHIKFKATEGRQFILYTGLVLLKEFLDPQAYEHFLWMSLAYRTLFSQNLTVDMMSTAQKLLERFVGDYQQFYKRNVAYNVHSLLHLVDCVRKH